MSLNRNGLYALMFTGCSAGYVWLIYNIMNNDTESLCMFKKITHIPCPSCGSTRSIHLVYKGQIMNAALMQPLGIIISILLLVLPIWILIDLVFKKNTLWEAYLKFEDVIKKRTVAWTLITITLLNWAWNIHKNL